MRRHAAMAFAGGWRPAVRDGRGQPGGRTRAKALAGSQPRVPSARAMRTQASRSSRTVTSVAAGSAWANVGGAPARPRRRHHHGEREAAGELLAGVTLRQIDLATTIAKLLDIEPPVQSEGAPRRWLRLAAAE